MTTIGRGASTAAVDRMWAVRDAVLYWLYISASEGRRHPHVDLEAIEATVGWNSDSITPDELDDATSFLKEAGYISGQGAWGGGIPRPTITAYGQSRAAEGASVKPGPVQPANPAGNTFHVTNYGTGNFNVGGHVGSQQLSIQQISGPVLAVADALDEFADAYPTHGEAARGTAAELREEAGSGNPAVTKLKALLASAIATVAVAAGSELGQQVTQLAVGALQSLG